MIILTMLAAGAHAADELPEGRAWSNYLIPLPQELAVSGEVRLAPGQVGLATAPDASVMVVEASLGAYTDMQGGKYIMPAPIHYFGELIPIVEFLIFKLFHGRPGYDHAIKTLVFYLRKCLVKILQMLFRGILGKMALGAQEGDFQLQGGITQQPQ